MTRSLAFGLGAVLLLTASAFGQGPTGEELALDAAHEAWATYEQGDVKEARDKAEQVVLRYRPGLLAYWVLWQVRAHGEEGGYHFDQPTEELRKYADQDPVAAFQLGIAAEAKGDYTEAAQRYRFVVESGLEQGIVYARLGAAEAALGEYSAAAGHLQQALAMDPKWTQPLRELPMVWAQAGDFEKATQAAAQAIEAWPENAELRHQLAAIGLARGNVVQYLSNIMQGTPEERAGPLHWAAAGWALAPKWGPFLAFALGWIAVMVALLCAVSRRRPGWSDLWFAVAAFIVLAAVLSPPAVERYGTTGPSAWRQAFVLLVLASVAFILSPPLDALWSLITHERPTKDRQVMGAAWLWFFFALFAWFRTRHSGYELAFAPVALITVGLSVYLRRGMIVCMAAELGPRRRGDYERVIRFLHLSQRLDGSEFNQLVVQSDIGDALFGLGRYDQALAISEKAIGAGVRPHSGVAASNAAIACADMGEYEEAWALSQTAAELIGNKRPFHALPHVAAAYVLMRQGRIAEALQAAHGAVALTGSPAGIANAGKAILAYGWAMSGQFPTATNLCGEVTAKPRPGLWTSLAHITVGMMWGATAHWEQALHEYQAAVGAWPANAEAHLRLAHALANLGRYDEARGELETARRVAPLHQMARMAGDMLQRPPETWPSVPVPMPAGSGGGPGVYGSAGCATSGDVALHKG